MLDLVTNNFINFNNIVIIILLFILSKSSTNFLSIELKNRLNANTWITNLLIVICIYLTINFEYKDFSNYNNLSLIVFENTMYDILTSFGLYFVFLLYIKSFFYLNAPPENSKFIINETVTLSVTILMLILTMLAIFMIKAHGSVDKEIEKSRNNNNNSRALEFEGKKNAYKYTAISLISSIGLIILVLNILYVIEKYKKDDSFIINIKELYLNHLFVSYDMNYWNPIEVFVAK